MKIGTQEVGLDQLPLRVMSVDIETSGLSFKDKVFTVGISMQEHASLGSPEDAYPIFPGRPGSSFIKGDLINRWSVVMNTGKAEMFSQIDTIPDTRNILQYYLRMADLLVIHNSSFDLPYLVKMGLLDYSQIKDRVFDTLALSRCTAKHDDGVSHSSLLSEYGIQMPAEYYQGKKTRKNTTAVPADVLMTYNGYDVLGNLDIFNIVYPMAVEQYGNIPGFIEDESRYACIISNMRTIGIPIDVEQLRSHRVRVTQQLAEYTRMLISYGLASKNDIDIIRFLADRGYSLPKTDKGNAKTDEASLFRLPGLSRYTQLVERGDKSMTAEQLASEIRSLGAANRGLCESMYAVLRVRALEKELSTWINGFQEEMDDRNVVHPLWGISATVSNRLNCTEPGVQAVPKHMRMYCALPGEVVYEADYEQAELRYGAAIAGETVMAEAFHSGEDIHRNTSKVMYGDDRADAMRNTGKRANFTGFYGGGAPALALALNIPEDEASVIINLWRKGYPNVHRTSKRAEKVWKDRGYLVLAHGKRLYASSDDIQNRIYKAFNQLVQGSIAEIIKRAMLSIDAEMPEVKQIGQIHDNLMISCAKDGMQDYRREVIAELMRSAAPQHVLRNTNPPIVMEVDIKEIKK